MKSNQYKTFAKLPYGSNFELSSPS